MPRLPSRETAFGPDRAPSVQRPIARYTSAGLDAPARAAAEQGEAFARIGGMGFELGRKMVQKEVQKEDAHARSTILQADVAAQAQIPTDLDNYQNYDKDYRERLGGVLGTALEGVKNATSRAAIEADFGVMVERGAVAMQGRARERAAEVGLGYLNAQIDQTRGALRLATNPEQRALLIESMGQQFQLALDEGYTNEIEDGALRRAFVEGYVTDWLDAMPATNRHDVLTAEMTTENGVTTFGLSGTEVDLLSASKRLRMIAATRSELAASETVQAAAILNTTSIQIVAAANKDPTNFANLHDEGMATYNAKVEASASMITDPIEQESFRAKAAQTRAALSVDLTAIAKRFHGDHARAGVTKSLAEITEALLLTANAEKQQELLSQAGALIDALLEGTHITETRHGEMEKEFSETFAIAWVDSHDIADQVTVLSEGMLGGDGDGPRRFPPTGTFVDQIPDETRNNMLNSAILALNSRASAAQGRAKSIITDLNGMLTNGHEPDPATWALAFEAALPYPELTVKVKQIQAISVNNADLRRLSPGQLQAYINAFPTQMTPFQSDILKGARGVQAKQNDGLREDAYSFGLKAFNLPDGGPLNPMSDESIDQHVGNAEFLEGVYGVDVSPMTAAHARHVARQWQNADTQTRQNMVKAFGNVAMEKQMQDRLLNTINPANPHMALLVELSRMGFDDIVNLAIQGDSLIANVKLDLRVYKGIEAMLLEDWGEAMQGDKSRAWLNPVIQVVAATWAETWRLDNPDAPMPIDFDLGISAGGTVPGGRKMKEVLGAIFGEITTRNGEDFLLPRDHTDESFSAALNYMPNDHLHYLKKLGDTTSQGPHRLEGDKYVQITARELAEDGILVTIGQGQYSVWFPAPGNSMAAAVMADGTDFVLDLDAIEAGHAAYSAAYTADIEEYILAGGLEGTPEAAKLLAGEAGPADAFLAGLPGSYDLRKPPIASLLPGDVYLDKGWTDAVREAIDEGVTTRGQVTSWLVRERGFTQEEALQRVFTLPGVGADEANRAFFNNTKAVYGTPEWRAETVEGIRTGLVEKNAVYQFLLDQPDMKPETIMGIYRTMLLEAR